MSDIDWGMLALGMFLGIVGTVSALFAFVIVEYVEYRVFKDNHKTSPEQEG